MHWVESVTKIVVAATTSWVCFWTVFLSLTKTKIISFSWNKKNEINIRWKTET